LEGTNTALEVEEVLLDILRDIQREREAKVTAHIGECSSNA
jgi:predicted DNA-binding ribbon-helix-helix protein